jgi:sugar phosphate isomerase/epimerase
MVRDLSRNLRDCCINTATLGFQAPIAEVIEAVARAGFGCIAPWRREVEGQDVNAIAQHIRDAGLRLSGYCRSPYIPAASQAAFLANIEANRRTIDDAAILGAPCLVMVVGSLPEGTKDIAGARKQVQEALVTLLEHGRKSGVRIGLEPLHPVYAADRSCLSMLSEALDWCDSIEAPTENPWLGTVIDVYHVWWDPNLSQNIVRAGREKRIFGFHVCDWLVPTQDVLNDRGMMGDGIIDVPAIRALVEGAGYQGAIECEIFSARNWWRRPMDETLAVCRARFANST